MSVTIVWRRMPGSDLPQADAMAFSDVCVDRMPYSTFRTCKSCGAKLAIYHGEGCEPEADRVAAHDEVCPKRARGQRR